MGSIIEIPATERAHARDALRAHFGTRGDAELERWMARWIGTFETLEAYVERELDELLPPRDQWLAGYVNAGALARDWADCCRVLYGRDRRGRVHVFAWLAPYAMDPAEKRDTRTPNE